MTASQIGGLCLFIGLLAHQIAMAALLWRTYKGENG